MLKVENITKRYPGDEGVVALDDLSFSAPDNQVFTILGPSGCGKTTCLRCIAGLGRIDEGKIFIDGKLVSGTDNNKFVNPESRDIGFVFQSYNLWPHMTAHDNIKFPLKARNYNKKGLDERVKETLELVDLPDEGSRYPYELSGGQQQRIAFARAIAHEPSLLLMDEPLSSLDYKLRKQMRVSLLDILEQLDVTTIYVTHNQEEAFEISDTIALMNSGRTAQVGSPQEIHSNPKSAFVANFIGESNIIGLDDPHPNPDKDEIEWTIGGTGQTVCTTFQDYDGVNTQSGDIQAFIPAKDVEIKGVSDHEDNNLTKGNLVRKVFRGDTFLYLIDVNGWQINAISEYDLPIGKGDTIPFMMPKSELVILEDEGNKKETSVPN